MTSDPASKEKGLEVPDTLVIVAVLFPGFLSERVAAYFSSTPDLSELQLVAAAMAATVLNLSIAVGAAYGLQSIWYRCRGSGRPISFPELIRRPSFLAFLCIVSILTGIAWAKIDSSNSLFRLGLTNRASRVDPWTTAFQRNAKEGRRYFVRVTTKDNGVFHGLPVYFSQGAGEQILILDSALREVSVTKAAKGKAPGRKCAQIAPNWGGTVVLKGEQIQVVEFVPRILVVDDKGQAKCKYSCDIQENSKPCPRG